MSGTATGMAPGKWMHVDGVDSGGEPSEYKIYREALDELIVDSFP